MKDTIFEKQALLIKFFNGEADAAEKAELEKWLDLSEDNRNAFNRFYDQDYIREKISRMRAIEGAEQENWQKITDALPPRAARTISVLWKKYAVAAAAVLLIGSSVYFAVHQSSGSHPVVVENTLIADLPPGGNKAVLTLADGSRIVLDSAANGKLAEQGNTKIIKLHAGELAYSLSSGTSVPLSMSYNTITTPRGGQYQIVLHDGSKVWLNAASSIRFPASFDNNSREVYVTGEAYFEIAPVRLPSGSNMPFKVTTDNMSVDVLGTSFNINAYYDESVTRTTLISGSVKVSKGSVQKLIRPGGQASINKMRNEINVSDNVDTQQTIAWKNGLFRSESADLKDLMRQVSRWYNVDISYEGKESGGTFTGALSRNMTLTHLLRILEISDVHVKYEMLDNKMKIRVY